MIRIVILLVTQASALAAMVALPIHLPWTQPTALLAMPEELVAAGLLRAGAIAIVGWLLVSTLGYAAAVRSPLVRPFVGRVTAPWIRRLVDTALAASLSLGVGSPAAAAEAPSEPIVVTVDDHGADGPVVLPPGMAVARGPTNSAPEGPTTPAAPTELPPTGSTVAVATTPALLEHAMFAGQADGNEATYEVRSGDHLWSIAERILEQRTGRYVIADHEIAPFWRDLIELNLSRLRSGDPDLIYPGEILTIPESLS